MNEKAVIFDVDGVLVDSYSAHRQSWRSAAALYGLAITDDEFARNFGRTSRDIISTLWPGRVAADQIPVFVAQKETAYREILGRHLPVIPGAPELLAALHAAGFRIALGSSGPPENVDMVRRGIPNGQFIAAAVDGTQVTSGKPDPQVFLLAAGKLGVEPPRCAVVEDAPAGIEAARRAGMTAIALTGTATRPVLSQRAHLVVDSLTQLSPQIIFDLIVAHFV